MAAMINNATSVAKPPLNQGSAVRKMQDAN